MRLGRGRDVSEFGSGARFAHERDPGSALQGQSHHQPIILIVVGDDYGERHGGMIRGKLNVMTVPAAEPGVAQIVPPWRPTMRRATTMAMRSGSSCRAASENMTAACSMSGVLPSSATTTLVAGP